MKKILIVVLAAAMFAACGEDGEEDAAKLLAEARVAMERGYYDDGRMLIDSMRLTYPYALKGRRNAIRLENELEVTDAKATLVRIDSALAVETAVLEALKKEFVLEKDEKYQAVGYYVSPDQVASKMHRTTLRAMVNEEGLMVLVSILRGDKLEHKTISVESETSLPYTTKQCFSFLTHNVVGYEEEASYKLGEDGGVIDFMDTAVGKLTVTYNGASKSLTRPLAPTDLAAIRHCYVLAKQIQTVRKLQNERKSMGLKLRFYEKKSILDA